MRLKIILANWPLVGDDKGENNMDGGWFYNGTKGFVKVDARLMEESLGNDTGFALKLAINKLFCAKNPFTGDDISGLRWGD